MSNNLLKQLEDKINEAIDTIELSRMEITELKEQKDELENRYADWEEKLSELIEKFEQLEGDSTIDKKIEEPVQEEFEGEGNESVKAEDTEKNDDNLGNEETEIDSVDDSDQLEVSDNHGEDADADTEEDSEEFLVQDNLEEVDTEIDQSEESVFGPNADSYTESPGSTQHYA